jgi:hypothetical protein
MSVPFTMMMIIALLSRGGHARDCKQRFLSSTWCPFLSQHRMRLLRTGQISVMVWKKRACDPFLKPSISVLAQTLTKSRISLPQHGDICAVAAHRVYHRRGVHYGPRPHLSAFRGVIQPARRSAICVALPGGRM